MAEYQEYKSYGAYLGRVLLIIIAFAFLVFAIWFVVDLARGDDPKSAEKPAQTSEVAQQDEPSRGDQQSTSETEQSVTEEGDQSQSGDTPVASEQENQERAETGQTLATNTEDLPNTGISTNFALIILTGALTYIGVKNLQAHKNR